MTNPIHSLHRSLVLAMAITSATLAAGHAAGPSFDCAGARGEVEIAICRSPKLATLDAEIATVYRQVMAAWKDDASARDELRRLQRAFLDQRSDALAHHDEGLEHLHEAQLKYLRSIDVAPRRDFQGRWGTSHGGFQIRLDPQGWAIWGAAAEPVRFRWICEIDALGRLDGADFVSPPGAGAANFPEWSLRVERIGALVRLREFGPPGTATLPDGSAAEQRPHCGHNGRFDGVYLPQIPDPTARVEGR